LLQRLILSDFLSFERFRSNGKRSERGDDRRHAFALFRLAVSADDPGIFLTIFCLMFVIVFVELLRRVSDNPQTGPGTVALMSIMRAPYSTEMILPFAVLFGSMATFVDLTRKLELVVARAAGMSVWQFLAPPLLAAFFLGCFRSPYIIPCRRR